MAGRILRELYITKQATLALRRLKNSLPENIIGRPAVIRNTYPLLKRLIHRFCNEIPYIYGLEEHQTCNCYQYLLFARKTCQ